MELTNLVVRHVFRYRKSFSSILSCNTYRYEHQLCAEAQEARPPIKLSTLYVPGRCGADMYQIVKPFIDVDEMVRNIDAIQHSCNIRGIDVDMAGSINLLRRWQKQAKEYTKFVDKDKEYIEELNLLKYNNGSAGHEKLQKEREVFIEGLKIAKNELHDVEDLALPVVQKLPNVIHPLTPLHSDNVDEYGMPSELKFIAVPHQEICKKLSLSRCSQNNARSFYLTGMLSNLELAIQTYFYNKFKDSGFAPMSCVDFCKSFILEAVGLDPYSLDQCIPMKAKTERGQKLNLVGGASFESFCAYLTNMNVLKETLPMRYFSVGRRYTAEHRQATTFDLFSVVQSSNVHCVTLCEDTKSEDEQFSSLFDLLLSCYAELKIPFRIVSCAAKRLNATESRRKQLELWSCARQAYIPVAHVSGHGDFVSKRLHVTYGIDHNIDGYCCVVEGVAVNIPVLIGCIVENFQKPNQEFDFPEELGFLYDLIDD